MPHRLRALLRQALTVHVPDPADTWRLIYDPQGPHHRAQPYRENTHATAAPGERARPLPSGRARP